MIHHAGNPLRQPALEDPGDEQAVAELLLHVRITPRPAGTFYIDPDSGQMMSLVDDMPVID